MKNLIRRTLDMLKLDYEPIGFCVDEDKALIYIVDRQGLIHIKNFKSPKNEAFCPETQTTNEPHRLDQFDDIDYLVIVEYLIESSSVCIIASDGTVYAYTPHNNSSSINYKHPNLILCASFSPDQELLTFIDINTNLCLLGPSLKSQRELCINTCNSSQHKQVGVGWGSKETQFFGLDGRQAHNKRIKTIQDLENDTNGRKENELVTASIDWRNDGQLLATMTRLESRKNQLKVWNRNLDLLYMSDQLVDIMGQFLSWTPGGEFITCVQLHQDETQEILFFEKNGLVHGRFEVPKLSNQQRIEQLAWSGQDGLLAVQCHVPNISSMNARAPKVTTSQHYLFIYKSSNFSWQLKETTKFSDRCWMKWDSDHKTRLHLVSRNGTYCLREYIPCYNVLQNYSTIVVIDGQKLKVTPLTICSVPPPMCAFEVTLPNFVSSLNVRDDGPAIVMTIDEQLLSIGHQSNNKSFDLDVSIFAKSATKVASLFEKCTAIKLTSALSDLTQFILIPDDCYIATHNRANGDEIILITPDRNRGIVHLAEYNQARVLHINCQLNKVTVVLDNGRIDQFEILQETANNWTRTHSIDSFAPINHVPFIKVCSWTPNDSTETRLITLSYDRTLRIGSHLVSAFDVTSFELTKKFMFFTTVDNMMRCVLLEALGSNSGESNKMVEKKTESWSQNIEQGALLVSADESTARLILQMPRGNLEIMYPRVLIFNLMAKLLDANNYLDAIALAKQHRINMNAIVDYDPTTFTSCGADLTTFVRQVSQHNVEWLTLFISELENANCLSGQYASICALVPACQTKISMLNLQHDCKEYEQNNQNDLHQMEKVNCICQNFIRNLERINDPDLINPLLMSFLKQSPPCIKEALTLVRNLEDPHSSLKFIRYMISEEMLFTEALGTYDTKLALMVASVSNKDPKEYVALINQFDEMRNIYGAEFARYKIDLHIKRYYNALKNAYYCYEKVQLEDEVLELIQSKSLYADAISIFSGSSGGVIDENVQPEILTKIWQMYGKYLMGKRYFIESGLAFEKAQDYHSAFKSYQIEGDCNRAIASALMIVPDESSQSALRTLANSLVAESKHAIAASIFEKYCFDLDASFNALMTGRCWAELKSFFATHQSFQSQSFDELVLDHHGYTLQSLESSFKLASSQYDRLIEVVRTRTIKRINQSAQDSAQVFMDVESITDCSSTPESADSSTEESRPGSSTASTLRTKKLKKDRRQTRKKGKIKLTPGSRYEHLALTMALREYVIRQEHRQTDYNSLCAAISESQLSMWQQRTCIERLSDAMRACDKLCKTILNSLWPDNREDSHNELSVYRALEEPAVLLNDPDVTLELLVKPKLFNTFQPFALLTSKNIAKDGSGHIK